MSRHAAEEERSTDSWAARASGRGFEPCVWLAPDRERGHLFAPRPIGYVVDVVEADNLRVIGSIPVWSALADLEWNHQRRLLYVASYPGWIEGVDPDAGRKVVTSPRLGSMLCNISLDPRSGRLFAASGCGIVDSSPMPGASGPRRRA